MVVLTRNPLYILGVPLPHYHERVHTNQPTVPITQRSYNECTPHVGRVTYYCVTGDLYKSPVMCWYNESLAIDGTPNLQSELLIR